MQTVVLNPRFAAQWLSEWRYYHLVYKEGEMSNNPMLCDVALHRFSKLLTEIHYNSVYIEDLELPDLKFILSTLQSKGFKVAIKHRPIS